MANPLFNAIFGGSTPFGNMGGQIHQMMSGTHSMPNQMQNMGMQDAMQKLRENPAEAIKNAGYNVPDDIANNPQATVMHLLQSGQIGGQAMQRIQPMLNMLMGRR